MNAALRESAYDPKNDFTKAGNINDSSAANVQHENQRRGAFGLRVFCWPF